MGKAPRLTGAFTGGTLAKELSAPLFGPIFLADSLATFWTPAWPEARSETLGYALRRGKLERRRTPSKHLGRNNLYNAELPNSKSVLVELEAKFRSTIWIKRGSYVVVDTEALADRDNKLDGEIMNVVRTSPTKHPSQ